MFFSRRQARWYCSVECQQVAWQSHKKSCKTGELEPLSRAIDLTVGLQNLGNTCYMNSMLQCLAASQPLVEYFTTGTWESQLNPENILGAQGRLARAFSVLMWQLVHGFSPVVSPKPLLVEMAKFNSQFEGHEQHDAHEWVTSLLDGLHEDVNLVLSKPIVEDRDSNGRPDAVVANEAWRAHTSRNESLVVDRFCGQLKRTVQCPDCGKVSVTFDPYFHLSLPLRPPRTAGERSFNLLLIRKDPREPPTRYSIQLDQRSCCRGLKDALAARSDLAPDEVLLLQLEGGTAVKIYSDLTPVAEIEDESSEVVAYEVTPGALRAVVVHRVPPAPSSSSSSVSEEEGSGTQGVSYLVGRPSLVSVPEDMSPLAFRQAVALEATRIAPGLDPSLSARDLPLSRAHKDGRDAGMGPIPTTGEEETITMGRVLDKKSSATSLKCICLDWSSASRWSDLLVLDPAVCSLEVDDVSVDRAKARERATRAATGNSSLGLNDLLELYAAPEVLDAANTWYCPECKDHKEATSQLQMWTAPDLLVVHLKRFAFRNQVQAVFNAGEKINTLVEFPLAGLDLSPYLVHPQPAGESLYDLFGVSNHFGTMRAGHYTAFTRRQESGELGEWVNCDDSRTIVVDPSEVVTRSAYVLFYQKRKRCGAVVEEEGEELLDVE